jgi:rod shape-determining protein MreC
MLKRPYYIALSLVLLLVLVVLNLPNRTAGHLKLAIGSMFLPLFGLASTAQQIPEQVRHAAVPRRVLVKDLQQLQQENQQLRLQAMQGRQAMRENARLRAMLDFKQQTPWDLQAAQIVGRDPANWWRTVKINRGSRDGVHPNSPVLTTDGLVGRVSTVNLNHSQVILVGDPNCRVSAMVVETQDHGIIGSSRHPTDPQLIELSYLSSNSLLQPGQEVITSSLGGIFPKGITIGEIVDVRSVGQGLYTEARVKLAVNLNQMETVWVMMR